MIDEEVENIVGYLIQVIQNQSNQDANWYSWVIENDPKFHPLPQFSENKGKINYLKKNLRAILRVFVKKFNITSKLTYDQFVFQFLEMLDQVTFPLEQILQQEKQNQNKKLQEKAPEIVPPNPPKSEGHFVITNRKKLITPDRETFGQVQSQSQRTKVYPPNAYNQKQQVYRPGNNLGINNSTPYYQSQNKEESKKRGILMKLAECFDQPEKRFKLFSEIKAEWNELNNDK